MRRVLRGALWVLVMLVAGELAVRAVALVLRRDARVVARAGGDVVYCIGDSFTYGQGVRPEEAWPQVLARLLADAVPGRAPQVRTLAEPGRSSSVAVVDVQHALDAGDARLVLVLTGWNANDG